jgi:hypothetical protein
MVGPTVETRYWCILYQQRFPKGCELLEDLGPGKGYCCHELRVHLARGLHHDGVIPDGRCPYLPSNVPVRDGGKPSEVP